MPGQTVSLLRAGSILRVRRWRCPRMVRGSPPASRRRGSRVFSATSLHRLASFDGLSGDRGYHARLVTDRHPTRRWRPFGPLQLWNVAGSPRLQRHSVGPGPARRSPRRRRGGRVLSRRQARRRDGLQRDSSAPGIPAVPLGRLGVWGVHTGAPTAPPRDLGLGAPGVVDQLVFAHRGHLLAVSRPDGSVWLLDPPDRSPPACAGPQRARELACVRARRDVGDRHSRRQRPAVERRYGQAARSPVFVSAAAVTAVAFDRTGRRLATSGDHDGLVKVWFTSTLPQEGSPLTTERGSSASLAFAAGTGDLFAVDDQGNGFTWPMSVAAWISTPVPWRAATSPARSGRGSTPAARIQPGVTEFAARAPG